MSYISFDWLKSFIILIPITWMGYVLVRRIITEKRAEIVFPLSVIAGTTTYIFLLNITAFVLKGLPGIILSLTIFLLAGLYLTFRHKVPPLDFPKQISRKLWIISLILWGLFLYIPTSHNIFGGEVYMYWGIGRTFAKGNFPIMAPWQPDLSVAYHYGGPIFLGAVNALTGVHFDQLQMLISILLILSVIQLLIWGWKRHFNIKVF